MALRTQIEIERRVSIAASVILVGSIAAAGVLAVADVPAFFREDICPAIALAGTALAVAVAIFARALVGAAGRQVARASLVEDITEARSQYDELAAWSPRWTRSMSGRVALSNLLLREERFREARDVLSAIPIAHVPKDMRWLHLDNRAVATAKAGDPLLAIPLAKQALACAPPEASPPQLAVTKATLGVAYLLAGQCEAAVPVLEEALAQSPPGDHRASAAFYLGEALTALGRSEEASAAYRIALGEAPDGEIGRRAKRQLELAVPYR